MRKSASLILSSLFVLAGCVSTPTSTIFNNESVPVYGMLAISCSQPYDFVNDCSNVGGPRKKLKIGDRELWIAGTKDGKTVFSRNVVRSASPAGDQAVANDVIAAIKQAGIHLVKVEAVMTGPVSSGHLLSFDGDAYTALSKYAVPAQ